ncbi:MAG: prepilin-type N-terminal cleavage/methylation domain-containing protein [Candidatus Saccharimonadales bacterium]
MSIRKQPQAGFTLVELVISMVLISIIGTTFLVMFKSTLFDYLNLQHDASSLTQLEYQSARITKVLRTVTNIDSADSSDITAYAYFYPSDSYVSRIHYYLQTSGKDMQLLIDVTPMTSNPPVGTPIESAKKTYVIIDEFYQPLNTPLFTYLDIANVPISAPVGAPASIKAIQVNLAAETASGGNQAINLQVSLRNRKINL